MQAAQKSGDSFHSPQRPSSLPALVLQEKKHTCPVATSVRQANPPERLPSGSSVQLSPPQHTQVWWALHSSLRKAAGGTVPCSAHNTFMHTASKKRGVMPGSPSKQASAPPASLLFGPAQRPSLSKCRHHSLPTGPISTTFTKHHCPPAERGPEHQ